MYVLIPRLLQKVKIEFLTKKIYIISSFFSPQNDVKNIIVKSVNFLLVLLTLITIQGVLVSILTNKHFGKYFFIPEQNLIFDLCAL